MLMFIINVEIIGLVKLNNEWEKSAAWNVTKPNHLSTKQGTYVKKSRKRWIIYIYILASDLQFQFTWYKRNSTLDQE